MRVVFFLQAGKLLDSFDSTRRGFALFRVGQFQSVCRLRERSYSNQVMALIPKA